MNHACALEPRIRAIVKVVRTYAPHVVGLQEVTRRIYDLIRADAWWASAGYSECAPPPAGAPYFTMLFGKGAWEGGQRVAFAGSKMYRGYCVGDLVLPSGGRVAVATTHLESPGGAWPDGGVAQRREQLATAEAALDGRPDAVLLGDLNWTAGPRGAGADQPGSAAGLTDAWSRLRPDEAGFTYDCARNTCVRPPHQGRLDRVLARFVGAQPTAISFVGTQPLSRHAAVAWANGPRVPVYPSDHFGLLADFGLVEAAELPATHDSGGDAPEAGSPVGSQGGGAGVEDAAFARWVRAEFPARSVRAAGLRGALRVAGVASPSGRSVIDAVKTARAAFGDRVACGRFTVQQIKGVLAALRQSRSGNKAQLVERLSNCLTPYDAQRRTGGNNLVAGLDEIGGVDAYFDSESESSTEAAPRAEQGVEKSLAAWNSAVTTRSVGALMEPSARVGDPAAELASDFMNVYEDALDDFCEGEAKDVVAEAEALLPFGDLINPRGLSVGAFAPPGSPRLPSDHVAAILSQGVRDREMADPAAPANPAVLDPTQRAFFDFVEDWALRCKDARERREPVPDMRVLLLGTAGTGKSTTLRETVRRAREILGREGVVVCAHTGVAAYTCGEGAETINSTFHISGDGDAFAPRTGVAEQMLVGRLRDCRLVVIDEVSMVGSEQLATISSRLQQVAVARGAATCRKRDAAGRQPSHPLAGAPFGGCAVIAAGDFAQFPPIGEASLLGAASEKWADSRRHGNLGRRLFGAFEVAFKLRRIYRQRGASAFKDSTLRLRDAAMTLADHALWATRDLADLRAPAVLRERAAQFVALCAENATAGARNGQRAGALARESGEPILLVRAAHNDPRAASRPANSYSLLRAQIHLVRGAKVMLLVNKIYDVRTVSLGLMNGARGEVVGAQFATGSAPPDLPEYVIVDFPGYSGPPLFLGEGQERWVPIPPVSVRCKGARSFAREQVPLRLAWALSVSKSQGLTIPEGVVVDLQSKCGRKPASDPGCAFVAWTRAQSLDQWACWKLPDFASFLAARDTRGFKARAAFEERSDAMHEKTLRQRGISPAEEVEAHIRHFERQRAAEGEPTTTADVADIRDMLAIRGVRDVPPDVAELAAQFRSKPRAPAGKQADVFKAFAGGKRISFGERAPRGRPRKRALPAGRRIRPATSPRGDASRDAAGSGWEGGARDPRDVLAAMGFAGPRAAAALAACGGGLAGAIENLLLGDEGPSLRMSANGAPGVPPMYTEVAQLLTSMGVGPDGIRRACDLGGSPELVFYRASGVASANEMSRRLLASRRRADGDPVLGAREAYEARFLVEVGARGRVIDLGAMADGSPNACLFLSVAAALSRLREPGPFDDRGALDSAASHLEGAQATPLDALANGARPADGRDAVGRYANVLRRVSCDQMADPAIGVSYFPWFARVSGEGGGATYADYERWLSRVQSYEFADACHALHLARMLRLWITILPPAAADVVSDFNPHGVGDIRRIFLGNNDVHYVMLVRSI